MSTLQIRRKDEELFATLFRYRFLTTDQVARTFFKGHRYGANRRLKQLCDAGYVAWDQERVTDDRIWRLTRPAVTHLVAVGWYTAKQVASWRWKWGTSGITFKEHEVEANELGLSFERWVEQHEGVTFHSYVNNPRLRDKVQDRDGQRYPVRPDRMLVVDAGDQRIRYFIEHDRDSERPVKRLCKKLYAYSVYYQMPHVGRPGDPAGQWPFRVLVTVPSFGRLLRTVEGMGQLMEQRRRDPSLIRAYAVFADVTQCDPYEPVWFREYELYRVLDWLGKRASGRPLRAALDEDEHSDIRQVLGSNWLDRPYLSGPASSGGRKDRGLGEAFVKALVSTGRLDRFSVAEAAWETRSQ